VPAASPEVQTVAAMTDTDGQDGGKGPAPCAKGQPDDTYATYSNYAIASGEAAHAIAAPGTCVPSTNRGRHHDAERDEHGRPIAGMVALCLGSGGASGPCTGLSPQQILQRMRDDAAGAAQSGLGFLGDPLRERADSRAASVGGDPETGRRDPPRAPLQA
jgi:subtilisin